MNFIKFIIGAVAACAMVAVFSLVDSTSKADTQVMQIGTLLPYTGDFLNGNMVQIPLSGTTNLTPGSNSQIVTLKPGCGVAVYPYFSVTNANGFSTLSNVTLVFATSPWTNAANAEVAATPVGTTNFTTITNGMIFTGSISGTNTAVMGYVFLPWTNIAGSRLTLVSATTTATNVGGVNLSNVWWKIYGPQ